MIAILVVLWSAVTADIKYTSLDYRAIQQLSGIKRLVKLDQGVVATCNLVLIPQSLNYRQAEESCSSFDVGMGTQEGQLVTIKNKDRSWAIELLMEMGLSIEEQPTYLWSTTRWAWTGLRKTHDNVRKLKRKEWGEFNAEDWEWADGTPAGNFSNWRRKQPDQKREKFGTKGCDEKGGCFQNYVRINHIGEWDDGFAYTEHPYICEYEGRFVVSGERRSHEEAKKECRDAGLELARIRSDGDLEDLKEAASYYLGSHTNKVTDSNNWLWVGGRRRKKREGVQVEWEFADCEKIEWDIEWEYLKEPVEEEKDVLTLSRWGTIDAESKDGEPRPFACQCPNS